MRQASSVDILERPWYLVRCMARRERIDRLAPTLTLCVLWLVVTGAAVVLNLLMNSALPSFVAKAGPFIIAGFITGRLVSVSERRPEIIAAAVLAVVSAAAWTSFSFATHEMSVEFGPARDTRRARYAALGAGCCRLGT
jgi:hypothetical protein